MGEIAKTSTPITEEATRFRSAVSESLLQIMGGDINYLLAAVLPVGSIVDSMLTEAQFQDATSDGWVLADGRDVSTSQYAITTGFTTVPDLRGVFRRGKNNGRSTATGNTAGDSALGAYQADQNLAHSHTTASFYTPAAGMGIQSNEGQQVTGTSGTGSSGGSEANPRNVTVNVFIRIN